MSDEFKTVGTSNKYYPTYMYYTKKAYPNALQLMKAAIQDERNDELFYEYLISIAPSEKERKIISSIRDDERKHNKMFREIYYQLTGKDVPPAPDEPFQAPSSYLEGIEQALFGELSAVEKYRQILFGLDFQPYRNMLTEIYTDELKHAAKWNFLYTINYSKATVNPTQPVNLNLKYVSPK